MVTSPIISSIPTWTLPQATPVDTPTEQPGTVPPTDPIEPAATTKTENSPISDQRGAGVLRKLLSGHFKGVSQLRLRINFHEELTAAQTEMAREATGAAVGALVEAVAAEFATSSDFPSLDEGQLAKMQDLQTAFAEEAKSLLASHLAGQSEDEPGLVKGLEASFEALTAELAQLFAESVKPEATDETTVIEEPGATPKALAPEFQIFLSALRETFSGNLAKLLALLEQESWLPELSAPRGKGRAYEKFLARYESLQAPPAETLPKSDTEGVAVIPATLDALA